jgi:hypothetical protein
MPERAQSSYVLALVSQTLAQLANNTPVNVTDTGIFSHFVEAFFFFFFRLFYVFFSPYFPFCFFQSFLILYSFLDVILTAFAQSLVRSLYPWAMPWWGAMLVLLLIIIACCLIWLFFHYLEMAFVARKKKKEAEKKEGSRSHESITDGGGMVD